MYDNRTRRREIPCPLRGDDSRHQVTNKVKCANCRTSSRQIRNTNNAFIITANILAGFRTEKVH